MKYAICNETFDGWDHERVCRLISSLGYTGLEIAPYTVAQSVREFPVARRQKMRRQAEDCGIEIVGLHWLLARTEGLHLTSQDKTVRDRTAAYLIDLARCCRDLGGQILVLGSPKQRQIPLGQNQRSAFANAVDTLAGALPAIADQGITLCLEPLSKEETDFINTCAEARELLDEVANSHFVLHLDVKAMTSEKVSVTDLIRKYGPQAGHFHANDSNKRGPGFGSVDFVPILKELKECGYRRWISVEVFDYSPDPETIARESIRYLRECEAKA